MKKITLSTLLILAINFFSGQLYAQDGYTYTLVDNGSYSYSVSAVPNASASNFATSVQSYGFTIILPDGVTASITSSLGNGAGATFFDGNNVGDPTIDGYLITETLGSPIDLPAPSGGTISPMVTVQVNGSPTTGSISVLANNSSLATTVTPLKSFMQADMVDDGSAMYTNTVDPNASGLSGTTSYMFETLSTLTTELVGISLYPNPTKDMVTIRGVQDLKSVEVFNMNGQRVLSNTSNLETINMSALQSGMYFAKLTTEKSSTTIKLIKE